MTPKSLAIFALILLSTVAVQAQTYQWKDGNGNTVVSDTPPPANAKGKRALGEKRPTSSYADAPQTETTSESAKSAEAPKSTADRELEFKKRQQEAREKAEKQAKEQKADADRRENCDRARRNLTVLESEQPVGTYDNDGSRQIMDQTQRQQEIARARQVVAESCR